MLAFPSLALVTGATSGIGKALAYLLADKGISLILTGRQTDVLADLKLELQKKIQVHVLSADLGQKKDRESLIQMIHQMVPDLVINNAGFGLYGEVLTYETQEQAQIFEVNARAVLELTIEAARALVSHKKTGTILNVSSAAAFQYMPNLAVYACAKTFVNQFSQTFDYEMQPYGVRVLANCPGMVDTHFQEHAGGKINLKEAKKAKMTPQFVAQEIWKQIQTGQSIHIIDWKYRFLTYFSYLFPKRLVATLMKKELANRLPSRPIIEIYP